MSTDDSASSFTTRHHFRFWQWVRFDPPMRDASSRGCQKRAVSCQECSSDLGTIDDPVDGFFVAWRHRRTIRRGSSS